MNELEDKYKLTYGILNNDPDQLLSKIDEMLKTKNLKDVFRERKNRMLSEKIDLTSFMYWLINEYPESINIMKNHPQKQLEFI
jgi:uncharacterized protein